MAGPIGNINNAISAYSNTASMPKVEESNAGEDFSSLVQGAIKEAIKIGERGEQMSIAAVKDRADLNQVVTAVAEAEVTLQTVVAVRDKVLEAYKEIIRMPI